MIRKPWFILFQCILVTCLLAEPSFSAELLCLSAHNSTASSDETYLLLKSQPKQAMGIGVHELLKKALYPIAERIGNLGKSAKPEEIRALLIQNQREFPIHEGEYEMRGALRLPTVRPQTPEGTIVPAQIKDNIDSGNFRIFRYDKNPRFAVHDSQKNVWIDPPPELVQDFGVFHRQLSTIVTPVGAYGEHFSRNLLRTTQILMTVIAKDPALRKLAAEAYRSHSAVLSKEMARVRQSRYERTTAELGILSGALEGVLSFHQFVISTLGEKMPGIESGSEALRQIVENAANSQLGITAEFTSRLPMGLLAPMTLAGYYFKSPYEFDANHKLQLTDSVKKTLAESVMKAVESGRRKSRCPMAGLYDRFKSILPGSHPRLSQEPPENVTSASPLQPGLQIIAEAYLHIFQTVEKQNEP